jgi:hypothetical protein
MRREGAGRLEEEGDEALRKTRWLELHGTVPQKHEATSAGLPEMNLNPARAWCNEEPMIEFFSQAGAISDPARESG